MIGLRDQKVLMNKDFEALLLVKVLSLSNYHSAVKSLESRSVLGEIHETSCLWRIVRQLNLHARRDYRNVLRKYGMLIVRKGPDIAYNESLERIVHAENKLIVE